MRRIDNITDEALAAYTARYGDGVTKDHIFAYVYGILHSPEYRERYATDLAKMLPRIPEVTTADAFYGFAQSGQYLLDLHINYEQATHYPLREEWHRDTPEGVERWYVRRMKWAGERKEPDRSAIVVNDWLTLSGIPDEAHEYIVGPRSALEWLIDRYRVKKDKASGIVNDPNDWGLERGQPSYIPDLIKSIVTVSVETVRTVRSLPPLDEAEPSGVKVAHKMSGEAPRQGALTLPPEPEPPREPPQPGVLYKGPTLARGAEEGPWSTLPRCGVCLMPGGDLREWGIWEPGSDRHDTTVWLCPEHEPTERM